MIHQTFSEIYDPVLAEGAILNERMQGFKEDYLMLHCLLVKYNIKSCFEIGTHTGWGTKIIKNALGSGSVVYSLDLPDEDHEVSKQHPISEGKPIGVGKECDLPFIQLRGDSRDFPYHDYPSEAFWIDAEHTEENVFIEVMDVIRTNPKIIILHDTDMFEVMMGLTAAVKQSGSSYTLYRITDTRVSYLLKTK